MSFEGVVDAAVELLRRRRRVTYVALQREFGLDDAALSDLKAELIFGRRIGRDEGGIVLVCGDGADMAQAERRRLTVLFCDLIGSTKLSSLVDPEDLREIMRSYYDECTAVLHPLGGFVAQFHGDGILAYFGYPVANEDDAERAVRGGLSIVRRMRQLDERLGARVAGGVAVRVGIHTGLVIVGAIGDADNSNIMALGEAPNLASRIQNQAARNTVLVSQTTLEMLPRSFVVDELRTMVVKEGERPLKVARVLEEVDAESGGVAAHRIEDPAGHLGALQELWHSARRGGAPTVEIRGAAGLGKTRFTDELCALARKDGGSIRILRCSAFNSQSAFHPLAQHLLQRAGLNPDTLGADALDRLMAALAGDGIEREDAAPLLGLLFGLKADADPNAPEPAPTASMQSVQELLLGWVRAAARSGPTVMVWEDVHWADPSCLLVLKRLLEGPAQPGLLVLVTTRPEFVPPWDPAALTARISLEPMDAREIRHLVQQMDTARVLAPRLVDRIADIAEGVPLYAAQITRSVLDSNRALADIEVPATLHASLMARLDRMGRAKSVVQIAALLGREFSMDLLSAASDMSAAEVTHALAKLVAADILQQMPDVTPPRYAFCHALLQAEAGESLLRPTRQATHARIAEVLQERFPATVDAEPETLARHLTAAGRARQAIIQWQRAGEHALARSAVREGLSHLQEGMKLLPELAAGADRSALELSLQIPLASALRALRGVGAPETGAAYQRASDLARELDDQHRLLPALNGVYSYHLVSANYDAALAPALQLLDVARATGDRMFEMIGLRAMGAVAFHTGDPASAATHLERSLALYEPERDASMTPVLGIDHKVMASIFLALTRFVQGRNQFATEIQRGLAWAEHLDHAHSTAQALLFSCMLMALDEDWKSIPPIAVRTMEVGIKRGFPIIVSGGRFFLGAARAFTGELDAGLQTMRDSATEWWATNRNYRPLSEVLLARAHALCGDLDAARDLLDDAQRGIDATGERWIEAEVWRVRGELLVEEAREVHLQRALAVARAQEAAGFEQRALRSLAAQGFA